MNVVANNPIKVEDIAKVYSGKPGCGCGCKGKYWTDERNIKRIVGVMNARPEDVRFKDNTFYIEDDKRYFWAYTQAAV